jgi:hypothetical protein
MSATPPKIGGVAFLPMVLGTFNGCGIYQGYHQEI